MLAPNKERHQNFKKSINGIYLRNSISKGDPVSSNLESGDACILLCAKKGKVNIY